MEYFPNSKEAEIFRDLAQAIMENDSRVIPMSIHGLCELGKMNPGCWQGKWGGS